MIIDQGIQVERNVTSWSIFEEWYIWIPFSKLTD